MHAMQIPSMHTLLAPQDVPFGLLPDAVHVDTPVEQVVVPTLQGSAREHGLPCVHAAHAPALQTFPVPQDVPVGTRPRVSEQLIVGEQTDVPTWQGLAGVQASPPEQATQAPPLQTVPAPHDVPSGAFPDSKHTGTPVLQTVMPVRQGFPGMAQFDPTAQGAQVPVASQTMPLPQTVPTGRSIAVSEHVAVPPMHPSAPLWHGFVGAQAPPAAQAAHTPAWQTIPVPQLVPSGWLSDSVQTKLPVAQLVVPTRHAFPESGHGCPLAHVVHAPA